MSKVVCVSGYFDPLHIGHLEYLQKSKAIAGPDGKLVVIVNNDQQATLKKGKPFMLAKERVEVLRAIKYVDCVMLSIDEDRTVCASLREAYHRYGVNVFTNGGDQTNESIPESPVCLELGIDLVDSLGEKIQSSSWLTGLKKKE